MELVIASNNLGKINEFKEMLKDLNIEVLSAAEFGVNVDDVIENGATYRDNALLKAQYVYDKTGKLSLADDSGLTIVSLPEILAVHTARFMGKDTPQIKKNEKVIALLEGKSRAACFESVLALVGDDLAETFHGRTDGHIAFEILGEDGFGYDPIFVPEGSSKSYAQMTKEEKNAISHRGRAVRLFYDFLKDQR